MSQEVPDGSVYVVHEGRLRLIGVWDEKSSSHVERGIERGPDDGVFHTFRPNGRIRIEADLAVPDMEMPGEVHESMTEASDYHGV